MSVGTGITTECGGDRKRIGMILTLEREALSVRGESILLSGPVRHQRPAGRRRGGGDDEGVAAVPEARTAGC